MSRRPYSVAWDVARWPRTRLLERMQDNYILLADDRLLIIGLGCTGAQWLRSFSLRILSLQRNFHK
jgi:hypothetical protein